MDNQQPAVMTVEEVAEYLRIPRGSVYRLAQRGGIPAHKVGRHWRFRRETIDRWLDAEVAGHHARETRSDEDQPAA